MVIVVITYAITGIQIEKKKNYKKLKHDVGKNKKKKKKKQIKITNIW